MTTAPKSFDHSHLSDLPEYQAFRRACSDLFNAAQRADAGMEYDDVMAAALSSYAGDTCQVCVDAGNLTGTVFPHKAEVQDGSMEAQYRCPTCGYGWSCGWTTDPEVIAMMP